MTKHKIVICAAFCISIVSLDAKRSRSQHLDHNPDVVVHHIHEHKDGSSLEEFIVSSKNNLLPGLVKGIFEGTALAQSSKVAGSTYVKPYVNDTYSPVFTEAIEGSVSATMDFLREDAGEFTPREKGYVPYLGEKVVHNTVKYLVGLWLLDREKADKKTKVSFIERYVNSSARGQEVLGTGFLRGGWNFLMRALTEGIVANNEALEFQWERGVAGASGAFVTEAFAKYALFKKSHARTVKRLSRLFSPIVGSFFKILLTQNGYITAKEEVTKFDGLFTSQLLNSKRMAIACGGLSLAAAMTACPAGERFLNNIKSLFKIFNLAKESVKPI